MKSRILSVAAMVAVLSPASLAFAQQTPDQPGSIHGHVQNAAGMAQSTGDVKLTTDRSSTDDKTRKYEYSFPLDANGDFKGAGIKPGIDIDHVIHMGCGQEPGVLERQPELEDV